MLKQNPFSLYDFLGYFVPGAFTLLLITFLRCDILLFINPSNLKDCLLEPSTGEILIFILTAYILGHLLSFLSSYTIEKYANWKYGYPSKYLLRQTKAKYFQSWDSKESISGNFWRMLLAIFILPTFILDSISNRLGLSKSIIKAIDPFLSDAIKDKTYELIDKLKLNKGGNFQLEKTDFHRIVSHYVYDNSKNHQQKMTNYVSLYGLLRTLTFIFNFVSYYLAIKFSCEIDFYNELNIEKLLILSLFFFLTFICFMAFMKFYKRYTLEGFMVLVATDLTADNKPKKNE